MVVSGGKLPSGKTGTIPFSISSVITPFAQCSWISSVTAAVAGRGKKRVIDIEEKDC
jgi:hypothetical protein